MKEINFNEGWKVWKEKDSFALVWSTPEDAKEVTLPHDAMIEEKPYAESKNGGNTGFRDGGYYTYVKNIEVSKEDINKKFILRFDGIYMNAYVYVNEQLCAQNHYGYTAFYADITSYLRFGEKNEIRIQVRNGAMGNSRWYTGSGIYRDVTLLTSSQLYVKPGSVKITTLEADEDYATVNVKAIVKNETSFKQNILAIADIDKEHKGESETKNFEIKELTLMPHEERKVEFRLVVDNPKLWSEETPELYGCKILVKNKIEESETSENVEEIIWDQTKTTFGIRTLDLDVKRGLRVNKKVVKLRGACIHHDNGLLGSATYFESEYRRIKILKEAGFNAIRMSHHPSSEALLKACDILGMYVMEEAFDMWTRCKTDYDYNQFFMDNWEKDITSMVEKDYNHPSVLMYSIGNEIPEIGTDEGAKIAYMLSEKCKELDPTRYTLASINGVFAAGDSVDKIVEDVMKEVAMEEAQKSSEVANLDTKEQQDKCCKDGQQGQENQQDQESQQDQGSGNVNDFMTIMDKQMGKIVVHEEITKRLDKACAHLDIAGYNYMTERYALDAKERPNRIMVGSETYPPEIAKNWNEVMKYPQVIGDFTWTGWDYIGEAGVGIPAYKSGEGGFGAQFPAQIAYVGDVDITGFRRPASYYREIVFGRRKKPYIAVQNPEHFGENLIKTPWVISDAISSWTFSGYEDKPVVVEVYSPADEVELLVNGKTIARKPSGKNVGFRTCFETVYEPGEIKAVSYIGGKVDEITTIQTAGFEDKKSGLEKINIKAEIEESDNATKKFGDGNIVYVPISLQDSKGNIFTDRDTEIEVSNLVDCEILGFGSADPKTSYMYNVKETKTWNGRALLILRKTGENLKFDVSILK